MGTKYVTNPAVGFGASAPPDDGTQVAANLVTWAGVKTKLADPIHVQADGIDSKLVSALDLSARAISSNDTAVATDHWKTLQVTGATTISLSSAASMGAGYEVGVFNAGTGVVTVTPAGSDTINGLSVSVTVSIKGTKIFRTNQGLTGYNVVGQTDPQTLTTTTSVITPLVQAASGVALSFGANASSVDWQITTIKELVPAGNNTQNLGGASNRIASVFSSGVSFPAAQSASADANTLDDYEEGTWTPSIGGSATYTTQLGTYTKIGRLVFITGNLVINSIGTGSTTDVSGLPFSVTATCNCGVVSTSSIATSVVSIVGVFSGTSIQLRSRTAAATADAANAIFQNGAIIFFGGCYPA